MPVDMTIPNSILGAYVTGLQMRRQRERDVEEDIQKQKIFDEQMRQFNENLKIHQENQKLQQSQLKLQHDMDIFHIKNAMRENAVKGLYGNIRNNQENPWAPGTYSQIGPTLDVSEQFGGENVTIPGSTIGSPESVGQAQLAANKPLLEYQHNSKIADMERQGAITKDVQTALQNLKFNQEKEMLPLEQANKLEQIKTAGQFRLLETKMETAARERIARLNAMGGGIEGLDPALAAATLKKLSDWEVDIGQIPAKHREQYMALAENVGIGFANDPTKIKDLKQIGTFAGQLPEIAKFIENYKGYGGNVSAGAARLSSKVIKSDAVAKEQQVKSLVPGYVKSQKGADAVLSEAERKAYEDSFVGLENSEKTNWDRYKEMVDTVIHRFNAVTGQASLGQKLALAEKYGLNNIPKTVKRMGKTYKFDLKKSIADNDVNFEE